jgi:protein-L-isoaspartate(D-aspartate) O-methyltransferase
LDKNSDAENYTRRRQVLVAGIREKGVIDERVLQALEQVPRHLFMPPGMEDKAYIDKAFPIGEGQTISQPYTVAYQTQLLSVQAGDKIMEVGTGSAYQAAVLAVMGAEVYTIERQKKLFDKLESFDYLKEFKNLHLCYGDGYKGWPKEAPFDKIIITAAPEDVPFDLIEQLKTGGFMVVPVGKPGMQRMLRLTKESDNNIKKETFDYFSFVPMLEGKKE